VLRGTGARVAIKAIETIYNGYRFRSRLEARWAVFFDRLDLPYEYEPQGYDLGGLRYLPDFRLRLDPECWIEVKARPPSAEEREKARQLAARSGLWVFLFHGDVWCLTTAIAFSPAGYECDGAWRWHACPRCDVGMVGRDGRDNECPECERAMDARAPRLMSAYLAARQARFEHGETPRW
jgi:hypothetical protein